MGLLATGISCFAHVKVKGLRRVPLPPLSTRAFILISLRLWSRLMLLLRLKCNSRFEFFGLCGFECWTAGFSYFVTLWKNAVFNRANCFSFNRSSCFLLTEFLTLF